MIMRHHDAFAVPAHQMHEQRGLYKLVQQMRSLSNRQGAFPGPQTDLCPFITAAPDPLFTHAYRWNHTNSCLLLLGSLLPDLLPWYLQVRLRSHQYKGTVRFRLDVPITAASKKAVSRDKEGEEEEEQEEEEEKVWGNYARGAAWALTECGHVLHRGISGVVSGHQGVDCAGISSSAAVGVAYLLALAHANDVTLSPADLIELDRRIENGFLGLRNGILDQSAIVLSKRGCLTLIRCRERTHETIPFGPSAGIPPAQATDDVTAGSSDHCPCGTCTSLPISRSQPSPDASHGVPPVFREPPFQILLAFSGIQGALVSSGSYNRRVDECREAASLLLQVLHTGQGSDTPPRHSDASPGYSDAPSCSDRGFPKEAGHSNGQSAGNTTEHNTGHTAGHTTSSWNSDKGSAYASSLSDITPEQYEKLKHLLPEHLQRRAAHFFSERGRVQRGVDAWRTGDLAQFGHCVSESGLSSIRNYECGNEPLIQLREILLKTPGVLGARFSGAGFRGCCVALVWRCMALQAAAEVAREYEKCQPVLAKNIHPGCAVVVSDSGHGARILAI